MKELIEQYPNTKAVFETDDAVTLTAEEHEILHTYFQLESGAELIEREYHFYMGQSMMFSYGSMLAKLKKEIMNPAKIRPRSMKYDLSFFNQNIRFFISFLVSLGSIADKILRRLVRFV